MLFSIIQKMVYFENFENVLFCEIENFFVYLELLNRRGSPIML